MMWGYGPQSGMMGGYGYGGSGPLEMIVWIIVLGAVAFGVIWLVRTFAPAAGPHNANAPARRSSGLDVLEDRYARGEINRDEYLQKRSDLLG